jgi:hypothetical protein
MKRAIAAAFGIAGIACAALAAPAAGEVYSSDASAEISGSGARNARSCTVLLKPARTLGDDLAPRLVLTTSGLARLSFGLDRAGQFSNPVLVQNNSRRSLTGAENAGIEQFRLSDIGKALRSGRPFFVTAQRSDTGKFVSSRYERIDFDAILARIEAACPFDAESLLSDAAPRQRTEQSLALSPSELTLIRWALNRKYAGQPGRPEPAAALSPQERENLKRYAADNGLPISQYLTAETARRLAADGQLVAAAAAPPPNPQLRVAVRRPSSPSETCSRSGGRSYCATSVLAPEHGFSYGPDKIADGRLETAWVAGQGARGDGVGEWMVIALEAPQSVSAIKIYNGYQKNTDIFRKNNRVRDLEIAASNGLRKLVTLSDAEGPQLVWLDEPAQVEWIQLTIRSVYRGFKYRDTAISEFSLTNLPRSR